MVVSAEEESSIIIETLYLLMAEHRLQSEGLYPRYHHQSPIIDSTLINITVARWMDNGGASQVGAAAA